MNEKSRTANAIKNSTISIVCQLTYILVSFICRTVFTKLLGAEYLGINGLFTDILTILSFAELGIGTALVYRLYEPLANNDYTKLASFMHAYKKIYRVIILVMTGAGMLVIPFLKYLVTAPNVKESLTELYILYLLQILVSYFFVYKKSLLIADQKDYIVSLFTQSFNIIMNVAQCIILVYTHNFVFYCIANIVTTLLDNIVCSVYVDYKYSNILNISPEKLNIEEKNSLFKDAKGLLLTKVAGTVYSGTDNIFISVFIGIQYVGILSNYTLILKTINTLMNKVFGSITASLGNLAVSKEKNRTEVVLKRLFFLNTSLYGLICLEMVFLIKEFVTTIWLSEEYVLTDAIIVLAITELFIRSIHYPAYITRNAFGLFSQYKAALAGLAFLNIVLDFILVKPLGVEGLLIATILCRGVGYCLDIIAVYRFGLQKEPYGYFRMVVKWFLFLMVLGCVCYVVINMIKGTGIIFFVAKGFIIFFIYVVLYILAFYKSDEWKYYYDLIVKIIHKA